MTTGSTTKATAINEDDVQSTPTGWRIISTGELIPFSEAFDSEDGLYYRCHKSDGSLRCFFAPGQGS